MKKDTRRCKELPFIDPEFVEALYEAGSNSHSSDRQALRKTQQFCRQVQRALNLALAGRNICEGVTDVFVEEVLPAPDCGRLLVRVVLPAGVPVVDTISALGRETARLRSDVASAITRKRAPELCFVPAYTDGGEDE